MLIAALFSKFHASHRIAIAFLNALSPAPYMCVFFFILKVYELNDQVEQAMLLRRRN